jgi:hypothetical protein
MAWQKDTRFGPERDIEFGYYLTTFFSKQGQVRADIFRRGKLVEAHVSFAPGVKATTVTDPYIVALWDYAREEGVADKFRVIFS